MLNRELKEDNDPLYLVPSELKSKYCQFTRLDNISFTTSFLAAKIGESEKKFVIKCLSMCSDAYKNSELFRRQIFSQEISFLRTLEKIYNETSSLKPLNLKPIKRRHTCHVT